MKTKLTDTIHNIEHAIEARGVVGVEVTMDPNDPTAYLVGEVRNATEEAIAVQAAIDTGVVRVTDALHYPGSEKSASHLGFHHHQHTGDPALDILTAVNLEWRVFDSPAAEPVRTGTPID